MITEELVKFYSENLGQEWYEKLLPFLNSDKMENIRKFVKNEKITKNVYPIAKDMFRAFRLTPYSQVKVVIIGQDPYHTPGIADGLAFSSKKPVYIPPSLKNIFIEVNNDLYHGITDERQHLFGGNLDRWAEQGVLLLNTSFTVLEGQPSSHVNIWKPFTDFVVGKLAEKELIYLLWGNHARSFKEKIKGTVFESAHPSPFSADRGFFGCKHFSKVNSLLEKPINW